MSTKEKTPGTEDVSTSIEESELEQTRSSTYQPQSTAPTAPTSMESTASTDGSAGVIPNSGTPRRSAPGLLVHAFVVDPLRRAVTHPVFWIEGTARFIRDRTVLAALVVLAGLYVSFGARWGWIEPPAGLSREGLMVAGTVVVMSALWLFETIPVAATALLPMVLFPMLGIQPASDVAGAYGNTTILLLMGSFLLARGVEFWEVPNVLAARVGAWAKGSPTRLIYGLIGATLVVSPWISNTAATLIMVTVGMAAVRRAEAAEPNRPAEVARFKYALLIGIAYTANIGGISTPIASPPNMIMIGLYQQLAPDGPPISFVQWMVIAVPIVAITVPIIILILVKVIFRFPTDLNVGTTSDQEITSFSRLPVGAKRALAIFAATAFLWVFRVDIVLGPVTVPGWSGMLGLDGLVDDAVVAILGATAMFLMPAGRFEDALAAQPREQAESIGTLPRDPEALYLVRALRDTFQNRVLTWEAASDIPWHLLVLFGGGLALAGAFDASGLSTWVGGQLGDLAGAPGWLVILGVAVIMGILTEFTSNTASAAIVLPMLAAASDSLGIESLLLMLPAVMSAAACFLMPIATPPNAIAAGAGDIPVATMVRAGLPAKLVTIPVVALVTWFWGGLVTGLN